jgi:four helix bundle protein
VNGYNLPENGWRKEFRFALCSSHFTLWIGVTGLDKPRHDLPDRTFEFAKRIVELCIAGGKKSPLSRPLWGQLLRCATSVGANIEEGQGSHSRAEFAAKYGIACKEAREARYWLRLLTAAGVGDEAALAPLIDEAGQLVAILTTIVRKVKKPRESEV